MGVPRLLGMIEANPAPPEPQPPATDAAVLQWDEALRALYFAELREQHGQLPN